MAKRLVNTKVIIHVIGTLMVINAVLMLFSLPFAFYYGEDTVNPILISSLISGLIGGFAWYKTKKNKNSEIKKRDGYLIVTLGWLSMALFGSLPYLLSGSIPNFSNAIFETMSGFSTTGATILDDIEALPKSILFWRSMTQWIGGMGIIVLTIAILPLLGIGGMELFVAEAPGPTKDKIHPRIKETAKRLWGIYLALTLAEIISLLFCGMDFYDAVNHALTTASTGGFSPKQNSIAFYNSPAIDYVIVIFMFLAGTNFTLLFFGFNGQFKRFWNNDEFKWYLLYIGLLIAFITPFVYFQGDGTFEKAFRDVVFQVVSIVTTTGFASADFTTWGPLVTFIFFLLLFSGASAGSTSGGIKIVRIILLMKNGFIEFKRRLHPNAVIPVYLNKTAVSSKIIYNLLAFIFLYLFIFTIGSIAMTALGLDFLTAISSVATALGNVGPGISSVGPSETFAHLPSAGKLILAFLMLCGRLELFTVILLFTPYFWRRI